MTNRICPVCGKQFEYFTKGNRKYCDECRSAAGKRVDRLYHERCMKDPAKHAELLTKNRDYYRKNKDKILAKQSKRHAEKLMNINLVCPTCGVEFHPKNNLHQKYCSPKCMRKANQDRIDQQCKVDGCDRPVRARGMCSMHWRRWARATGREKNPEWNERRRRNYEKRRARKFNNGPVDDFTNLDVYDRDRWFCGICGMKVDKDLMWPDPMSASLDHIVPLSRGGTHTLDNVQLAHLACNERKHNSKLSLVQGALDFCA